MIQVGVNHKPVITSVGPKPIEPGNIIFIRGRNLTTKVPKNGYGEHRPAVFLEEDEVWCHEATDTEVICGTRFKDGPNQDDNFDPDIYEIQLGTLFGDADLFEMEIEYVHHTGPTPVIDRAVVTEAGFLFIFGPNLDLNDVDHHGVYVNFSNGEEEEFPADTFGGNSIVLRLPDGVTSGEVWVNIADRGLSNRIPFGTPGISGAVGGTTTGH